MIEYEFTITVYVKIPTKLIRKWGFYSFSLICRQSLEHITSWKIFEQHVIFG